jgi:ketosteroid isomerase-like protein
MKEPGAGTLGPPAAMETSGGRAQPVSCAAGPFRRSGAPESGSPEETLIVFVAALRRRDLEKASACLASDACFLTPDATAIHGRAEIVEVLSQLRACAIDLRIEMRAAALRAGDTALSAERWTVRTAGGHPGAMVRSFESRTVLRRIEDGWRILVLAPWGWR